MPSPDELPADIAQAVKRVSQELQEAASSHAGLDKCVGNLGSLMQQMEAAASKHQTTMASLLKQAAAKPDARLLAKVQEQQTAFNAQLMKLQMQMQREAQVMTSVSNVMKARHDTIKNSISNIR